MLNVYRKNNQIVTIEEIETRLDELCHVTIYNEYGEEVESFETYEVKEYTKGDLLIYQASDVDIEKLCNFFNRNRVIKPNFHTWDDIPKLTERYIKGNSGRTTWVYLDSYEELMARCRDGKEK